MLALLGAAAPVVAADAETEQSGFDDIIVTAQRREQTLLQVPQSVAIVSGAALEEQHATSFLDYAQLVPGLVVTQSTPGQSRLILRGVNTGSVGSTVAVYVDDSPFGSSGSLSNGGILAGDFDTFDVERVEVLRGPQGTLYGSNALGGVLRFITAQPNTKALEIRGQAGVEGISGGGTGWFGNGVVNVPLGDTLAVRASGFYRRTAGYIDSAGRNLQDVNQTDSWGGRASLLFAPTADFSVRLFALAQKIDSDTPSDITVDPLSLRPANPITGGVSGDLQRYDRIGEPTAINYRLYSGTVDWNLGFANLASISSYSTQKQRKTQDISTNAIRPLANALYAPTAPGTIGLGFTNDIDVKKFTQEVRLVSPSSERIEWVVGGYYSHEDTTLAQEYVPFSLATGEFLPTEIHLGGATIPHFVTAEITAKYEEIAAYASATAHFGPRFDVTLGGRYSHNSQSSVQEVIQLGSGKAQDGESSEGVFTWSVSPRYQLGDNAAIYARVAKGYRPGGPNFIPPNPPAGYPSEFAADTLISYEAGVRMETPSRAFSLDASVYYLDWSNILILGLVNTDAGPVGVNTNGQGARSKGAEFTASARPMNGMSFTLNLAYTDAKLTDDTVPAGGGTNLTGGLSGDRLPYSPRISANFAGDYEWAIGSATASVGGNINLVGDQAAAFDAAWRAAYGGQLILPGYATVDLRAGLRFGNVSLSVYGKNLTNEHPLISAGGYPFAVPAAIGGQGRNMLTAGTIVPRTIGASLGFSF